MSSKSIHPFPARMAPEIAFQVIKELPKESKLLDPMMGSGTTLQIGVQNNCHCIGTDVDPLAILITKVALTYIDSERVTASLLALLKKVNRFKPSYPKYWDDETKNFAHFWFGDTQLKSLIKLSKAIEQLEEEDLRDLFRVALSRCIITKDRGASLASDVSHAKPHKTKSSNDFNVFTAFQQNVTYTLSKALANVPKNMINLYSDDARKLSSIEQNSIDCIITSPPYLHAVDYFRGHRLSLVWMGYTLENLRQMRSSSIGLRKIPNNITDKSIMPLIEGIGKIDNLPPTHKKHLIKYAIDIQSMCSEFNRVLKNNKKATVVIADAWSAGVAINNTQLIKNAAELVGLKLSSENTREIPSNKRYLPPPEYLTNSALDKRMKTEAILTFYKPRV